MAEKKTDQLKPRKCRFCRVTFTPTRTQDAESSFCCDECRVSFHKGGTKEYQRLMRLLVAEMTRAVHETAFHKILAEQVRSQKAEIEAAVEASIRKQFEAARRRLEEADAAEVPATEQLKGEAHGS